MNYKSKYIPLILSHTNNPYIKNEIKAIRSIFKLSFNLNYYEYFHNYGDYYLKKNILEYIEKKRVNLLIIFFHNDNFEISLKFLREAKKKAKIIFIAKDDATNMLIYTRYYAILSDCIVTNSLSAHFYYKSLNINSYISGDSRPKIKYYNSEKKLYDVSFIGSIIKGRRHKFINAIEKTNLRYLFIDTSNDKNRITENKYNKIIRQSYINLNFTSVAWPKYDFFSIFDPFINNSYGFKGRVIEAGMNKGFVLSEYDSDTKYFWRNNEVSFFYNKSDMLKKINYYLKNKNTRNLIANNIYKKCIKNHITINCYNSLLKKILKSFDKKIKHEVNQSINDVHFKKLEATFLLLYVFKMLKNLKFKAIIYTLNRFLSLNLINIFYAPINLMRYLYYFYLK
jgi:hypothetical protein